MADGEWKDLGIIDFYRAWERISIVNEEFSLRAEIVKYVYDNRFHIKLNLMNKSSYLSKELKVPLRNYRSLKTCKRILDKYTSIYTKKILGSCQNL